MARVVPFHPSFTPHGATRRSPHVGRATAVGALVSLLSLAGSAVAAVAHHMELTFVAWAEARRQREEDRKLWAMAQADPRLMADLIAVQQRAESEKR